MSRGLDERAGGDGRVLSARLDNVRLLSDALSCIYSAARKSQDVVVSVPSAGGLKFAVEQPGCLLASVLLPLGAFAHFACADAAVRVRLNLSLLLDCLNIFAMGGAPDRPPTPVRVAYDGDGHALVLRFHEIDSITVCRLNTIDNEYAAEMETDFQFMRHDVPNMALLESEALRDALAELDYAGATTAELRLAPTAPRFRFQSPAASFRIVDADDAERRLRDDSDSDSDSDSGDGGDDANAGANGNGRRLSARPSNASRGHKRGRSQSGHRRRGNPQRGGRNGDDGDAMVDEDDDSDGRGYSYLEPQCSVELADPEDRSVSVFSEFRSARAQTSSYRLELLSRCVRALSMSETCKVQMNADGMLSVVCRMRAGLGTASGAGAAAAAAAAAAVSGGARASADQCFTEFLIVADEIGVDDEGADAVRA